MDEDKMTEHERKFYKERMKGIRDALREGNEEKANRLAFEIRDFFGIK